MRVEERGWNCVEQFVSQLSDTIEELSMEMYYWHLDQLYFWKNADPFTDLCQKLHRLRSVNFSMSLQLQGEPSPDILAGFTRSFRTHYWLDGSFGRVNVAVDLHRLYNVVQISSLPYAFPWTCLLRSVDFVNVQFNTQEEQTSSMDPPTLLESSWMRFQRLAIKFDAKEPVPLTFLRALESAHANSRFRIVNMPHKSLALHPNRGILPENVWNHIQRTHFHRLELRGKMEANMMYASQGSSLQCLPCSEHLRYVSLQISRLGSGCYRT